MRASKDLVVLLASMAILAAYGLWQYTSPEKLASEKDHHAKEYARQKAIVDDVRSLVDDCKSMGEREVELRGKALIWEIFTDGNSLTGSNIHDSRSDVNDKLPLAIKAGSDDSTITVFMVTDIEADHCVKYAVSQRRLSFEG